ncbi:MAG TPA: hypothetical protein VMT52_10165 [Planctomycetota bacterium]|nr:hypothetical protein [Planctomycetota bacterium]
MLLPACGSSPGKAPGAIPIEPGGPTGAPGERAAPTSAAAREGGAVGAAGNDLAALQARAADLERMRALIEARAAGLADVESLMDALERRDGRGMSRMLEGLLLAGENGFAVLHDFFHQADVEHEKILTLTHHHQLVFAMLRIVALHPSEVASLSRYLMKVTRDRPGSFIRREIYNFLPVFLKYHQGKFPEVRKDLEEDILFQLEQGGEYLNKVGIAIRDLQFQPPIDTILGFLADPAKRDMHSTLIKHLVSRGDEGVDALVRHVREAKDRRQASVAEALREVAGSGAPGKAGVLEELLRHEDPDLRRAAILAHFSFPRGEESVRLAIDHLNAGGDLGKSRAFLALLRQRNRAFLALLKEHAQEVHAEDVRALLVQGRAIPPPALEPEKEKKE